MGFPADHISSTHVVNVLSECTNPDHDTAEPDWLLRCAHFGDGMVELFDCRDSRPGMPHLAFFVYAEDPPERSCFDFEECGYYHTLREAESAFFSAEARLIGRL